MVSGAGCGFAGDAGTRGGATAVLAYLPRCWPGGALPAVPGGGPAGYRAFPSCAGCIRPLAGPDVGWPRLMTLHELLVLLRQQPVAQAGWPDVCGPRLGWNCVDCLTVRADLHWMRALLPWWHCPWPIAMPTCGGWPNRCPSCSLQPILRQQYVRQSFPGERITVIDLGLDTRRLAALPENAWPEPPARPHFGFLGALAPHKGVDVLVRAFNQLPANVALTIFGSETAFPDYVARLKRWLPSAHPLAGAVTISRLGRPCALIVWWSSSIWYENSPM